MFEKTEEIKLNVSGMHCMHCKASVETALKELKGVKKADVDLEGAFAVVKYVPEKINADAMIAAVKAAGFEAELAK